MDRLPRSRTRSLLFLARWPTLDVFWVWYFSWALPGRYLPSDPNRPMSPKGRRAGPMGQVGPGQPSLLLYRNGSRPSAQILGQARTLDFVHGPERASLQVQRPSDTGKAKGSVPPARSVGLLGTDTQVLRSFVDGANRRPKASDQWASSARSVSRQERQDMDRRIG